MLILLYNNTISSLFLLENRLLFAFTYTSKPITNNK